MEFSWLENGKRTKCIYWADRIEISAIVDNMDQCDELQIWYPKAVDEKIYGQYRELLTFIELEGSPEGNSYTYENSLTLSDDEIYQKISKNKRYEIRRARERDRVTVELIEDISETDFSRYLEFYNQFALSKNLNIKNGEKEKSLIKKGMFCIAIAKDGEEVLAMHGYILDKEESRVLLYTSASTRYYEKEKANLIGRANCLLHYECMLFFKQKNYKIYDFSGAYLGEENKEFINITEFKMLFGGDLASYKNGFVIPIKEISIIEENLQKYREQMITKKVVLWGMGSYGKYIARRIEEEFHVKISIIIDNRLAKESSDYMQEDILRVLNTKEYLLLISVCQGNLAPILALDLCKKFIDDGNCVCMRCM